MAGNSTEAGRTVTSKLAAILAVFTTGGPYSLSTIAGQSKLPVSTAHRLLIDAVSFGLLERTGCGGYRPSVGLRRLAHDATAPTLRDRGPLAVDDLSGALSTAARLGVLDELEVAYIEKRPGPFPGTSFPNRARLPVHASALGKALLAHAPGSLVHVVLAPDLPCYTPRTIVSGDQLLRALHLARVKGFAVSDRELDDTTCAVAVPVFDPAGRPIAAVEVQVPRLCRQAVADVVPALVLAARGLSRELYPDERGSDERGRGPGRRIHDLPAAQ
jgi:DNA-binding IclR family transcriptional regulator